MMPRDDYEQKRAAALRWKWLRTYLVCAYCGKLLAWWWKFAPHRFKVDARGFAYDAREHRLIEGACQCERIGGHPRMVV